MRALDSPRPRRGPPSRHTPKRRSQIGEVFASWQTRQKKAIERERIDSPAIVGDPPCRVIYQRAAILWQDPGGRYAWQESRGAERAETAEAVQIENASSRRIGCAFVWKTECHFVLLMAAAVRSHQNELEQELPPALKCERARGYASNFAPWSRSQRLIMLCIIRSASSPVSVASGRCSSTLNKIRFVFSPSFSGARYVSR